MANDLINLAYIMEAIENPKRRDSKLIKTWSAGRVVCLPRAWKLCTLSHIPYPMHLFHLAVPGLYSL